MLCFGHKTKFCMKRKILLTLFAILFQHYEKDKGTLTFAGAFLDDILEKSNLLADTQGFRHFLAECVTTYRSTNKIESDVSDEKLIERIIPSFELNRLAKDIYKCRNTEIQDFRQVLVPEKNMGDYQAMTIFTRLINLFVIKVCIADTVTRRFKKARTFSLMSSMTYCGHPQKRRAK